MTEGYCSLAELCENEITDGTHQTPVYSEQGYIFLSSKDVTGGVIDWEHVKHIPENLHKELYARVKPQVDDILLAKNGTTGIAALVDRDEVFDIYVSLALIRPDKSKVIPQYLLYAINSQKTQEFFKRNLKGIGVPNLHLTHIRETPIKLHPKAVQKKIIEKLGCIDCLLKEYEEELDILETLVKSRFIEMFGDPVTNPLGWEEHRLDDYITFLTSGSRGWSKYFSDDGEIFITIKNVKNNRITLENVQYVTPPDNAEAQRTKVREGDLLISITADLGRTGVVSKAIEERGAYINQHLTCIRLKQGKINPGYVSYFMESEAGKRQFDAKNQAAVKAGLNFDAIKSLKLLVPPLQLQNKYMSFVELADKSKIAIQKSIRLLELLKASLMQTYFG